MEFESRDFVLYQKWPALFCLSARHCPLCSAMFFFQCSSKWMRGVRTVSNVWELAALQNVFFLWVILPPKTWGSLADRLLIQMMKYSLLHYKLKPSRPLLLDLRKHTITNLYLLTSHRKMKIQSTRHNSQYRAPLFSNTESIHLHSWKNTIPITEAIHSRSADAEPWRQATGMILATSSRLNRHLRVQWPLKAWGVKELTCQSLKRRHKIKYVFSDDARPCWVSNWKWMKLSLSVCWHYWPWAVRLDVHSAQHMTYTATKLYASICYFTFIQVISILACFCLGSYVSHL